MKPTLMLSLAIAALLYYALVFDALLVPENARATEARTTLDASSGLIAVHVHPGYRTELEFPDRIVKITGTASRRGQLFVKNGRVLSVLPAGWPKGDPRYKIPPSVNVFLPNRSYQLDLLADWDQTQHLFEVVDGGYRVLEAQDQALSQADRLFIAFVRQGGILPAAHESTAAEERTLKNGWSLRIDRAYTYGDWDFLAGSLTVPKLGSPVTSADLNALNLFPGRQGQVFVPGLDQSVASGASVRVPRGSGSNGPAQLPVYYVYLRRK